MYDDFEEMAKKRRRVPNAHQADLSQGRVRCVCAWCVVRCERVCACACSLLLLPFRLCHRYLLTRCQYLILIHDDTRSRDGQQTEAGTYLCRKR